VPEPEHAPWDFTLTPARSVPPRDVPRRRRGEAETDPATQAVPTAEDVADLERGRTAALLAAMGRLQVSIDLLTRKVGALDDRVARIETALRERDA
jgi:hypothetical protein